jgi:hypothetical protein
MYLPNAFSKAKTIRFYNSFILQALYHIMF